MSKQLQKCLELSAHQGSHLFHTFAVDAKIAVARAGSRTKVNRLRGVIEEKLDVIDEAEQQAGELVVEIRLVLIDELGARQCCDHRFQRFFCFRARLLVLERDDGMALITRLRRDAIGAGRARGKRPLTHGPALYYLSITPSNQSTAISTASRVIRFRSRSINTTHSSASALSQLGPQPVPRLVQ